MSDAPVYPGRVAGLGLLPGLQRLAGLLAPTTGLRWRDLQTW
ncbi:hypothetical protein [Streptomyces sp. NBC_01233]|nr:hypothetical protein OG332_00195 [Streptomyces sp. NBC_01233]WSP95312.1 hypothetical protein OG332_46790 [Streptomyces sp. NBC_01233]